MSAQPPRPIPAVVVGLCGHGLALARALHRTGIPVLALEATRSLPGTATLSAEIEWVRDINGAGLIAALQALARRFEPGDRPVLYLTNDRMVATVAAHRRELAGRYRLSWSDCAERLVPLLDKLNIEARCAAVGLDYPRSAMVRSEADLKALHSRLRFPIIFKPSRPLSSFKTAVASALDDAYQVLQRHRGSLPFIAQEFIPGDDRHIHFGALYLDRGRVLARFQGRKLRSRPMGHTTIAESSPNADVARLAERFYDGLEISGPVSLELKRGPDGRYWVIEPTVGRTDFWVDVCIHNGVDLPVIEYRHQLAQSLPATTQRRQVVWINDERDPFAKLWLFAHEPRIALEQHRRTLYFDVEDMGPQHQHRRDHRRWLFAALGKRVRQLVGWRAPARNAAAPKSSAPRKSRWAQWREDVSALGAWDALWSALASLLERISAGRLRLIRYHIVVQPIRPGPLLRTAARGVQVHPLHPTDPLLMQFPRPAEVLAQRFARGATCLAAESDGCLAGFIWLAFDHYEEDEVRCRFELVDADTSAWDFDVAVEPDFRMTRTFLRLWECANRYLNERGCHRTWSRISAFNRESRAAHLRLGAQRVHSATFLCAGRWQLSFFDTAPYIHLSGSEQTMPALTIGGNARAQSKRVQGMVASENSPPVGKD